MVVDAKAPDEEPPLEDADDEEPLLYEEIALEAEVPGVLDSLSNGSEQGDETDDVLGHSLGAPSQVTEAFGQSNQPDNDRVEVPDATTQSNTAPSAIAAPDPEPNQSAVAEPRIPGTPSTAALDAIYNGPAQPDIRHALALVETTTANHNAATVQDAEQSQNSPPASRPASPVHSHDENKHHIAIESQPWIASAPPATGIAPTPRETRPSPWLEFSGSQSLQAPLNMVIGSRPFANNVQTTQKTTPAPTKNSLGKRLLAEIDLTEESDDDKPVKKEVKMEDGADASEKPLTENCVQEKNEDMLREELEDVDIAEARLQLKEKKMLLQRQLRKKLREKGTSTTPIQVKDDQ